MTKKIEFKIAYHGGSAAKGQLELYSAGRSLTGLSRALNITTHAFLNDGNVRVRGDKLHGAQLFITAPVRGSFMESITVVFDDESTKKIGKTKITKLFYDFLTWTWSHAIGKTDATPSSQEIQEIASRQEPFISEISQGLETSLRDIHRPIYQDREMTIVISRPRVGELLRLDESTLDHVAPVQEQDITTDITGNVTKYNSLSGFGRFYDDEAQRTISFDISPTLDANSKALLTDSLHEWNTKQEGSISIDVKRMLTAHGELKRYTIIKAHSNLLAGKNKP